MNKITELIKKHKSVLFYLFFGILTTLVNIVSYYLFYNLLSVPNVPSTAIAWVLSVIFAFITNKLFVFESRSFVAKVLAREAVSFFGARALTGLLDIAIMYIAVDLLCLHSLFWKIVSNVIVVILNYVFSKIWIFKKRG